MALKPIEVIALSKAVSGPELKGASSKVDAGEYEVDFLVHVSGSVKRGEDYSQRIVAKADPWTLLSAALSHLNGVTVKSLVKEALTADPELVKSIKKQAGAALSDLKSPTETPCNGKITTKVEARKAVAK